MDNFENYLSDVQSLTGKFIDHDDDFSPGQPRQYVDQCFLSQRSSRFSPTPYKSNRYRSHGFVVSAPV